MLTLAFLPSENIRQARRHLDRAVTDISFGCRKSAALGPCDGLPPRPPLQPRYFLKPHNKPTEPDGSPDSLDYAALRPRCRAASCAATTLWAASLAYGVETSAWQLVNGAYNLPATRCAKLHASSELADSAGISSVSSRDATDPAKTRFEHGLEVCRAGPWQPCRLPRPSLMHVDCEVPFGGDHAQSRTRCSRGWPSIADPQR